MLTLGEAVGFSHSAFTFPFFPAFLIRGLLVTQGFAVVLKNAHLFHLGPESTQRAFDILIRPYRDFKQAKPPFRVKKMGKGWCKLQCFTPNGKYYLPTYAVGNQARAWSPVIPKIQINVK